MDRLCSAASPPANFCDVIGRSGRFSCATRCRFSRRGRCARAARSRRAMTSNPGSWNAAAGAGKRRTGRSQSCAESDNPPSLVNGVNLHVAAADELLRRFAFMPQARLDDVMVSYATPGGGVGPHVDRYDVFLLQGPGRRRWRVENKRYLAQSRRPAVPAAGRAARRRGARALLHLLDRLPRAARHRARRRVPRLAARARPARRGLSRSRAEAGGAAGRAAAAADFFADALLARIRWSRSDVERFVGEYLSSPSRTSFSARPRAAGGRRLEVRLDAQDAPALPRPALLHQRRELRAERGEAAGMRELADRRIAHGRATCPRRAGRSNLALAAAGYVNGEKKK